MDTRSTRLLLRQEIGEEEQWLVHKSTTNGGGGTAGISIVDTKLYSSVQDQKIQPRDVIAILEGEERGERSFAKNSVDQDGTVGISPDFTGVIATGMDYEVWSNVGPHPDLIDSMIDRALAELCWRWVAVCMTLLPGGDVGPELAVSSDQIVDDRGTVIWTKKTTAVATLPVGGLGAQDFPYVRNTAGAANSYLESIAIEVNPAEKAWRFELDIRAFAADGISAGEAEVYIWDTTNDAQISTKTRLRCQTRGWQHLEADFNIPPTCHQLKVRLQVPTSTNIGDFSNMQLWDKDAKRFLAPRRVANKRSIGPVFERVGSVVNQMFPRPYSGSLEHREAEGEAVAIQMDPGPGSSSYWYYEKRPYSGLTSSPVVATDDDRYTRAQRDWIKPAAKVLIYRTLLRRDLREAPRLWSQNLSAAIDELEVAQQAYGIEPKFTEDSPKRTRRITRRT